MMLKLTHYFALFIIGSSFLGACSRPVTYFQRGPSESYHSSSVQKAPAPTPNPSIDTTTDVDSISTSVRPAEVYAQDNSQPVLEKPLQSRLNHMTRIRVAGSEHETVNAIQANHKLSGFEQFLVKKLNKRISRQLAPQHPEKAEAVANTGYLIGGAVLLVGGLILLIAGTGTVAFIGLIVGLVGALGVILGLAGE